MGSENLLRRLKSEPSAFWKGRVAYTSAEITAQREEREAAIELQRRHAIQRTAGIALAKLFGARQFEVFDDQAGAQNYLPVIQPIRNFYDTGHLTDLVKADLAGISRHPMGLQHPITIKHATVEVVVPFGMPKPHMHGGGTYYRRSYIQKGRVIIGDPEPALPIPGATSKFLSREDLRGPTLLTRGGAFGLQVKELRVTSPDAATNEGLKAWSAQVPVIDNGVILVNSAARYIQNLSDPSPTCVGLANLAIQMEIDHPHMSELTTAILE